MAMVGAAVVGDSGFGFTSVMPLVLPPGVTQLGAMRALKPKIVSVEFGTSEILRTMLRPVDDPFGGSLWMVPSYERWVALYDQILDEVSKSSDVVVLALPPYTLPPGFVSAASVVRQLASPEGLAQYNIVVRKEDDDCGFTRAVYAPRYLRLLIAEGLAAKAGGRGPVPLICQQMFRPDLGFTYDAWDVIGPLVDMGMRTHIRQQADLRGFAYFDMNVLYSSYSQPPFNVTTFMTSNEPFGPYVSIDGIYPSRAGNALLAEATARALNERYGLGIRVSAPATRLER
jgi:hypothetical protein